MWTRRGDWKLIRLFHDGDDQSDRFELYNLRDDLSEAKNLAAQFPDKVHEFDALIDQHLRDTHVLVPGKNPAYSPLVPDWTSNPDTSLTVRDGVLVITPTGKGPSMNTRGLPAAKGPFTVELRMRGPAGHFCKHCKLGPSARSATRARCASPWNGGTREGRDAQRAPSSEQVVRWSTVHQKWPAGPCARSSTVKGYGGN